jgi:hypothetical protein
VVDLAHPDLAALTPGSTVHWRLVYCEGCDTADPDDDRVEPGADATFVAP